MGKSAPSRQAHVVTLSAFHDRWDPVKVRELIRELERAGWRRVRQKGSHRQFSHPERPGVITVSGNLGKDVPLGLLRAVLKQAGTSKEPK
jgi:predicted RNA binding protein YcfA (HicA-like mRNA interferase family)